MAKSFEDRDAIEHSLRVVSSLDSMVLGEAQITGQVKDGFRVSKENKTVRDELEKLLSYALKCAAEVRNSTEISSKPISIASVAVAKAEEELKSLSGMVGVVIGTERWENLQASIYLGLELMFYSYQEIETKL